MRTVKLLTLLFIISLNVSASDTTLYQEKYRPQYHFTPAHRWIGDPCGLLKFNGKYHAYSWGGAESTDLVHWKELNDHAIKGVPKGISTFTGGGVVDKKNSAGYGENAFVAAFTSYDEQTKKQSQSIAFSRDGGVSYQYYDLNPVIDIWSTEFRDPTVIWDKKNNRWVMLVAKALEKKVAFYGSDDLKHWTWLSEFGPMGDSERSWECPDLFQVSVDGNPDNKKWVLLVSVNWAQEQYFVGEFDGTTFIPDKPDSEPLYVDHGLDYYASRVFQDYDDENSPVYTLGWVNTWDYANFAPTEYGKGIWSIPREYRLKSSPDGIRLVQIPATQLEILRSEPIKYAKRLKPGITQLPFISGMGNTYEMDVEFSYKDDKAFGLYLCEDEGRKVEIKYDPASRYLTLDRTNVSDVRIPKFERISNCKITGGDGKLKLRIFVDKSTVELFVNDGARVLTMLTFPSESQTGASLYSLGGNVDVKMTVWKLDSIWQ